MGNKVFMVRYFLLAFKGLTKHSPRTDHLYFLCNFFLSMHSFFTYLDHPVLTEIRKTFRSIKISNIPFVWFDMLHARLITMIGGIGKVKISINPVRGE
jgi:hypothetical protein